LKKTKQTQTEWSQLIMAPINATTQDEIDTYTLQISKTELLTMIKSCLEGKGHLWIGDGMVNLNLYRTIEVADVPSSVQD
jgi:hypothetical protein